MPALAPIVMLAAAMPVGAQGPSLRLHAAGSLRAAMTEIGAAFTSTRYIGRGMTL